MKDDLISRSAFADLMCSACNEYFPDEPCEPSECDLCIALANAPAVDAVPVVRCFECKHRGKEDACPMWSREQPTTDWDEYCSRGERRDND